MPRQLKPHLAEKWKHFKHGVTVDLMLDRNTHTFFCVFQGNRIVAPSLAELQRLISKEVEASFSLSWIPMITVTRLKPFNDRDSSSFVGFRLEQSWIARKQDGKWLEASWGSFNGERDLRNDFAADFYPGKDGTFSLPFKGRDSIRNYDCYYLPYTEEVWDALLLIDDRIKTIRDQLHELLTTDKGIEFLMTFATKLLPASAGDSLVINAEVDGNS